MLRLYTLWQLEQELSPVEFRCILTPDQALKKAVQCYDLDYRNYSVPPSGEVPRRLSGLTKKLYQRADRSVFDPVYDDLEMNLYEGWIVGVDIDEPWNASINPFRINADDELVFDSPDNFCWEIADFRRAYQLAIKGAQAGTTVCLDNTLEDIRKTNQLNNITVDNISGTVAENSSFFHPVMISPPSSWVELLTSLVINNFSLNDIIYDFVRFINPGGDASDSNFQKGQRDANKNSPIKFSLNKRVQDRPPKNEEESNQFIAETVAVSAAASLAVPFIIPLLSWFIPGKVHGALHSQNQDEVPDNTGKELLSTLDPETLKLRGDIKFAIEGVDISDVIEGLKRAEWNIYSILRVRPVTDHYMIEMMNALWAQVDHLLIEANQYMAGLNDGETDNDIKEWKEKLKEKFVDFNTAFNYIETGIVSPVGLSLFDGGGTRTMFDKCKMEIFNIARRLESNSVDYQNGRNALGFKLFIAEKMRESEFVVLNDNEKIATMGEYFYKSLSETSDYLKVYSKQVLDEFTTSHFYRVIARKSNLLQSIELINKNLGIVFNSDEIETIIIGLQNVVGTIMSNYLEIEERDEVLTNNLDMLWINVDKLIAEARDYRSRLNENELNPFRILQEIKEWQMLETCDLSDEKMPVKYLTSGVPLSSWVALCLTNYKKSHFEQCKVILFRIANEVESNDLIYNSEHMAVPYKKVVLAMFENSQFASLSERKKIVNLLPEIHSGFKNKPEGLSSFANRVYEKMKADAIYSALIFRSGIQSRIVRVQRSIESALKKDNAVQMIEGIQDAENQMLMHFKDDELNSLLEIAWMNIDFLMTEARKFLVRAQQRDANKQNIRNEMLEWQREWLTRLSDHNTTLYIMDKDFISIAEEDSFAVKHKKLYFNEGKMLLFSLADEMEIRNVTYRNEHMALGLKIFSMNKFREPEFVVLSDVEKVKTMLSYLNIESSYNEKDFIDYSLAVTDMMWSNKYYLAIRNNSLIELYLKRLQRKLRMAFESDSFNNMIDYLRSAVDYADSGVKDLLYKMQYDGREDNDDISKLKMAWRKIEGILTQARQYMFDSVDYRTEIKPWQMRWKSFFSDNDMSARYLTTDDELIYETTVLQETDTKLGFVDVKKILFRIADETTSQGEEYDQEILRQNFKQLAADKFNDASFAASGEYEKISKAGTYLAQALSSENQPMINDFAGKIIKKLSNNDQYLVIKVSAMMSILKRPELNVETNIEKHISRRIQAYEKKYSVTVSGGSTKDISVILEPLSLAGMNNEGPVAPQTKIYTTTLKDILTGQYRYHVYEMRDKLKRPYGISGFGFSDTLIEELTSSSLEDEIGTEIDSFFNDAATEQALKDATLGMIRYRCMTYMDRTHREKSFYSAVRAFLEGNNQASTLAFHGITLDGVFYIPAGTNNGIIFSIHDSSFFHSVRGDIISVDMGSQKNHFYSYPITSEFRQWIRSHMSAYNTVLFKDDNAFKIMTFIVPDLGMFYISPLVFGPHVTQYSLASIFFDIQKERVKSDADTMILSDFEDVTLRSLQAFKLISGILSLILSGTGTPVGMATSLLLEAASIAAAAGQMKLTDIPDDYNNYLNELMIGVLLYGAGSSENIKTLRRVYRQGKKKLAALSGDILNPIEGRSPVKGGGKSSNEGVITVNDDLVITGAMERTLAGTKDLLLSDSELVGGLFSPEQNSAGAVITVSRLLQNNGYTDVTLNEIGIFANAHTISNNHYVIFARKNEMDVAVDSTVGKLMRYGFIHPVVSTKNSWLSGIKTAFDKKQKLLVKIKMDIKGNLANSPFSDSRMVFANDILPDEHIGIISGSGWYKAGGNDIIPVPKLLKRDIIDKLNMQRNKYQFYIESLSRPKASHLKLQRFKDGKESADAIYPSGAPERKLSEGELMDKFNNGEPTLEERGALSVLIESANKLRIQSHGLGLSRKYLRKFERGSTLEIAAPQQYIISRLGGAGNGRCFPLSISAAVASFDNKIEIFLNKLMYDNVDKNVLTLLDHLHGSSDVQSALRTIQFSNKQQSGTIDDIIKYIQQVQGEHYYHMKTSSHSMLLGLAEKPGAKRFAFYDPNFGYIEYKSFDALKNALKRNLERGELAIQYNAYNSKIGQAIYSIEEINISRLKELTFNTDGKL
ncbi:hypothetical protein [Kluyvera intermedia]|uniref:hypothetical protein n=1 Tax=Kluyvera intermedia TaxID=61648 RepID=UPI0035264A81